MQVSKFSDLITGKGYTSEDEPKEIRANIFASLALINNEALKECLQNKCLSVKFAKNLK